MSDNDIKQMVAGMPTPTFDNPAFVTPVPLHKATVAIVTTAGIHTVDQEGFTSRDTSFRVLDGGSRELQMGHWSPNFDRAGFAADINVVYPVDRLAELAANGTIGRVAPRHIAFTGNQDETMTAIRIDSGPAAAELLKSDGVDVVLFTPV
jgi:D-proline reductase (dithiol) PrdB